MFHVISYHFPFYCIIHYFPSTIVTNHKILSDESNALAKAHMRFDKAILIKCIYCERIVDVRDVNGIIRILEEFGSESSMVHYIHHYVPCHCFDELSSHYPIDG